MICLLVSVKIFGPVGVSAAGGVAHNAGQICAAWVFLSSGTVWGYFPVLLISGTVTGIITGIVVWFLTARLKHILKTVDNLP